MEQSGKIVVFTVCYNASMLKRCIAIALCLLLFTACGTTPTAPDSSWAAAFPPADMAGYEGLSSYNKELQFVDLSVQDVHALLEAQESFVLYTAYATCPWCNAVVRYLNDAALEAGATVALLDTRKDPAWESNIDIADYDLFVEDFGDFLDPDDENIPHLYVPHVFFVKNGKVVYDHEGALDEMEDDPTMVLSEAQEEALRDIYREGFRKIS